jgi:hypothetical protein
MVTKNARLRSLTEKDRLTVYMALKGNLASPSFGINSQAQGKQVKERARERVRESLTDRLLKRLGKPAEGEPRQPKPEPSTPP